jgi:Icc-related predicted phosphoesterase
LEIVAISDTHGQHAKLVLPEGDLLIHAGDISNTGSKTEVLNFLNWFDKQTFKYKIFIAGNHDFFFERESDEEIQKIIPEGIIYLKDSGVTINDIKIWGSPVTPWFLNWAFNRHRGDQIRRYWELIPGDTDILITHGPVFKVLDKNSEGQYTGCEDLLKKVREIRPAVHVFGHIHEAYGTIDKFQVKFINASVVNENYKLVNKPVTFEFNFRK